MRRSTPLLVLALFVAACSNPGSTPTGTASSANPGASGTATCQQAPSVPDNLEGWGPPASTPTIIPLLIGPTIATCGDNRVLFTILDKDGRPIGAPDRTVRVAFFDLARDKDKPFATVDGTFIWAIENERGIYAANVAFPEAGRYGGEFTTAAAGGAPTTLRLTFDVQPSTPVVRVGDKAPSTKTPTLADVGNDPKKISTDATPDPAFYATSVDKALADHKPFVLVFATPKFCASAQCGPTLDRIKPFVKKYPTVTFINVEPYKLKLVDGTLQADTDANGQLQTTQASDDWHLVSEPNVYVVDKDGVVTANFELIFSDQELTTALDAIQ
jgi:hypothetical protein